MILNANAAADSGARKDHIGGEEGAENEEDTYNLANNIN
jgi:hypothetical protein